MEELERVCCVCGYHVYKEIWEATTGEILICERGLHNRRDRYAVAVKNLLVLAALLAFLAGDSLLDLFVRKSDCF